MGKAIISNVKDRRVGFIKTADSHTAKISYDKPKVTINSVLPFRVRFINIGVGGYGPNNPAPIGIAIIGVNNYIL